MKFENEIYAGNSVLQSYFGDPAPATLVNQAPLKPAVAYRSFIDWLKEKFPSIYDGVAYSRPDLVSPEMIFASNGFLGDLEEPPESSLDAQTIFDKSAALLKDILPSYYQFKAQQDLIELNLERAKHGQSPIDSSYIAPTVKVGASTDIQRMLTFGLIGAFGLAALNIFMRSKSRR